MTVIKDIINYYNAISFLLFQRVKVLSRQRTANSIMTHSNGGGGGQHGNGGSRNPVAMGKAFLARAARSSNSLMPASSGQPGSSHHHHHHGGSNGLNEVFGSREAGLVHNRNRAFLMDTQVKYTVVSFDISITKQERASEVSSLFLPPPDFFSIFFFLSLFLLLG